MAELHTNALDAATWADFARLVEVQGFVRDRRIGKNRWVVRRTVA